MPKDHSSGGNGQGCTRQTAILMAKTADMDALNCFSTSKNSAANARGENINIFGVTCTAALVSATAKKGDQRCHVQANLLKFLKQEVETIEFTRTNVLLC